MRTSDARIIAELMEQLIETGPEGMASAFTAMLNLALRFERERHVGAQACERTPERNGFKLKRVDTPAGTLTVQVPTSRGGDAPFHPRALERGRRSSRAGMLAIARMYIQGVSTRDVGKVMAELGLEGLSSSQVSRAAALLWMRSWKRGAPARSAPSPACSSMRGSREGPRRRRGARRGPPVGDRDRRGGRARPARPLRRPLRGGGPLRRSTGAAFPTASWPAGGAASASSPATNHAGLVAARKTVFPGAVWQRCQFHLARNAIHVEIDEQWIAADRACITMNSRDG